MLGDNYEFSVIDEHGNSHEFYRHPLYKNYCCSTDLAEVYSDSPHNAKGRFKFIKLHKDKDGYLDFTLSSKHEDGRRYCKKMRLHRVIYSCFNNIPDGMVIDHIDHNIKNNLLYNLRAVSVGDNGKNSTRHGNIDYNFLNKLPEDSIKIEHAKGLTFDNLYYSKSNDKYYVDIKVSYRELHVNKNNTITVYDTDGNKIRLSLCYINHV